MNDLISKAKALKAIEEAARLCVADANHNYLMGFQDAAEAVGQVEPEHFRKATKKKGDDYISRRAVIDALEKVAGFYPYKVPGNRDSYDRYNEAWNDAIGRAEIEIEYLPTSGKGEEDD